MQYVMVDSLERQDGTFYETLLTQHSLFIVTRVAYVYFRKAWRYLEILT